MADEPERGRRFHSPFVYDIFMISEDPYDIFVSASAWSDTSVDAHVDQSLMDGADDGAEQFGEEDGDGAKGGDGLAGAALAALDEVVHEACGSALEEGGSGASGHGLDEEGGRAAAGDAGKRDMALITKVAKAEQALASSVRRTPAAEGREAREDVHDGAGGGSNEDVDDGALGAAMEDEDVGGVVGDGAAYEEGPGGADGSDDGHGAAEGSDAPPRRRRFRRVRARPRTPFTPEELTEQYLLELRVSLNVDARVVGNRLESRCQGAGASRGGAFIIGEAGEYIATWGALGNGRVIMLCSCAGVLGRGAPPSGVEVEHPVILLAMGKKSSSRHAGALWQA